MKKSLLLGLTLTLGCSKAKDPNTQPLERPANSDAPAAATRETGDGELLMEGVPVSEWIDMLRGQHATDAVRVLAKNSSHSSIFMPQVRRILTGAREIHNQQTYGNCLYLVSVMGPSRDLLDLLMSELEDELDLDHYFTLQLIGPITAYRKEAVAPLVDLLRRQRKRMTVENEPTCNSLSIYKMLGAIGKDALEAEPLLIDIVAKADDPHVNFAAEALARIGGPNAGKAIPVLVKGLKSGTEHERDVNAIDLVRIDPRNPELLTYLKKSGPLRAFYLYALHQAEPDSNERFKEWLDEMCWPNVHHLAHPLVRKVRQRSAVPALQNLVATAKSEEVVKSALDALTKIDPTFAIHEHIKILKSVNRGVILHLNSLRSLADLGPTARDAVPAIQAFLKNHNGVHVLIAGERALRLIQRGG